MVSGKIICSCQTGGGGGGGGNEREREHFNSQYGNRCNHSRTKESGWKRSLGREEEGKKIAFSSFHLMQ